jgi:hypothetical protein
MKGKRCRMKPSSVYAANVQTKILIVKRQQDVNVTTYNFEVKVK